jgi:hypothetical protein
MVGVPTNHGVRGDTNHGILTKPVASGAEAQAKELTDPLTNPKSAMPLILEKPWDLAYFKWQVGTPATARIAIINPNRVKCRRHEISLKCRRHVISIEMKIISTTNAVGVACLLK